MSSTSGSESRLIQGPAFAMLLLQEQHVHSAFDIACRGLSWRVVPLISSKAVQLFLQE